MESRSSSPGPVLESTGAVRHSRVFLALLLLLVLVPPAWEHGPLCHQEVAVRVSGVCETATGLTRGQRSQMLMGARQKA